MGKLSAGNTIYDKLEDCCLFLTKMFFLQRIETKKVSQLQKRSKAYQMQFYYELIAVNNDCENFFLPLRE